MSRTSSARPPRRAASSPAGHGHSPSLGPVAVLEQHLHPDWWRRIFNATYLKTDGDVVDDRRITAAETDLVARTLQLSPEHRILDLCCGQGRHTLELARRGFNAEGLDRSRYLIQRARAQARREGLGVRFREGDARKLPYAADTFNALTLLGNSFGYFETVEEDLRVLREALRILVPYGKLLLDVADGDWLREHFEPRTWEWIDRKHFVCRERSLSVDRQRLICREGVTHADQGVIADQLYAARLYNPDILTDLLRRAGFADVAFHGRIDTESQRNQDLGFMARRLFATAVARKDWSPKRPRRKAAARSIAVLLGDPARTDRIKPDGVFDEDDQQTVDRMKAALAEIEAAGSHRFRFLDAHDSFLADLIRLRDRGDLDYALNLCDEGFCNDARQELHIPALLDVLRIAYTGAGPQCLAYCYDKSLVRGVAEEMQIPVAAAFFIKPEDSTFDLPFPFPAIIKPNFGDSSFGITQRSVAAGPEDLVDAIAEIRQRFGYDKPVLVEQFLTGADLSIGVIGNPPDACTVFPVIEEDYSALPPDLPRICGYEAKWLPDSPYWNLRSVRADLPEPVERFMVECCLRLFERLECRDYARFDWRLDAEGNPRLLEVNPNPGWVWDGHLAKMAQLEGIAYPQMLRMILQAAEDRLRLTDDPTPGSGPAPGSTPESRVG